MKIINITQRSEEWLKFRRNKIGSSDTPIICGVSPYKNRLQLWNEKMGLAMPYETAAMQRGTEMEDAIRSQSNKQLDCSFDPMVTQHDTYDWMIASLDGFDIVRKRMIEIKTTSPEKFLEIVESGLPKHYYYQVQHALEVMGDNCILAYVVLSDGLNSKTWEVKRDQKVIDHILKEGKSFFESLGAWDAPEGRYTLRTDLETEFDSLARAAKQVKIAQDRFEVLKESLIEKADGESIGCGPYTLSYTEKRGVIDYKSIPVLKGMDLELYRKPTIKSWAFRDGSKS